MIMTVGIRGDNSGFEHRSIYPPLKVPQARSRTSCIRANRWQIAFTRAPTRRTRPCPAAILEFLVDPMTDSHLVWTTRLFIHTLCIREGLLPGDFVDL